MIKKSVFAKFTPLLAVGLLALTACAGPASDSDSDEPPIDSGPGSGVEETPGDPIPIEGIDGSWIYLDGTDNEGDVSTDATITLIISGDKISGQSACNNYATSFTGDPTELTIGPIASTKRACENALMDFDSRYFTALELVTAAIPTGGSLVLQGEGVNLNFLPSGSLPPG
ncbi:MAG: META domain-containing protein [Rhodoglobus sp.]